jgi:hypothetical protein
LLLWPTLLFWSALLLSVLLLPALLLLWSARPLRGCARLLPSRLLPCRLLLRGRLLCRLLLRRWRLRRARLRGLGNRWGVHLRLLLACGLRLAGGRPLSSEDPHHR